MEGKEFEVFLEMFEKYRLRDLCIFFQGFSHNINTPLGNIKGRCELLMMNIVKYRKQFDFENMSQENKDTLESLLEKIEKSLQESINQCYILMNMSKNIGKIGAYEYDDEDRATDINEMIDDILTFLNTNLEFKHNITKTIELGEEIPHIKIKYRNLSQSLFHLIANALDALLGREEKELTIRTELHANPKEIRITIADSGSGIPPEIQNQIFDPFFTTKSREVSDEVATGFGIGLNQCMKLFKPYGIKLEFTSSDKGSEFIVRIPETLILT